MINQFKTIAVIGQCRSGTSLTMQMLSAAGLTCAGDSPGFEDARVWQELCPNAEWINDFGAVKFVDPHGIPSWFSKDSFPRQIYCIRRDQIEQAKSIRKFSVSLGLPGAHPGEYLATIKSAESWYRRNVAKNALTLVFEDTLRNPLETGVRIAEFAGMGDPQKISSVIVKRSPKCFRGLLELSLLSIQQQKVANEPSP